MLWLYLTTPSGNWLLKPSSVIWPTVLSLTKDYYKVLYPLLIGNWILLKFGVELGMTGQVTDSEDTAVYDAATMIIPAL